jgi:NAD(P)-dependent dehydrogenase (short-subunit alcohol dehydrogenase family)
MAQFAGRKALVTGAASGIGLATAQALAEQGSRLVLVDANRDALENAAGLLGESVVAQYVGDVSEETFWEALSPALDRLALAIVNAGVSGAALITEMDFAEWRRILSVNLDGAFLTLRAAMRAMQGKGGAIVLTASVSGLKAEPGVGAYGASKAGLIQLARVAAKEGAASGIRVNAIAPGGVETPIWREMPFFQELIARQGSEAAAFDALAKMATPLCRYARADEIAAQILFLLSDATANITGTVLTSDGGYSL